MDARDKDREASPEVMLPDTGTIPPPPDLLDPVDGTVNTAVAVASDKDVQQAHKSPTPLQDSLRRLRRDKRATASIGVIILFILIAIFGPPIYQHIGAPYQSEQNGLVP